MTSTVRASALASLGTPEGERLLELLSALPNDRLLRISRARKETSNAIAAAAVELAELRRRAAAKFPDPLPWLTPEGLEQSTGAAIADYRASRFPTGSPVLDACCGIGGDSISLAARGPVVACDIDPAAAWCTAANLRSRGFDRDASVACADVTMLDLEGAEATGVQYAIFDPSRRTTDEFGARRRVRVGSDYTPPLSWLFKLRARVPNVAVKLSPAIDDATLRAFNAPVEFVSDRGECKEAIVWTGALSDRFDTPIVGYHAVLLRPGADRQVLGPFPCAAPAISQPRSWLLEPDPAVIRAHLIPQVAALTSAALIDPEIAYLTSDARPVTPFATSYQIVEWAPFQERSLRARLRSLGLRAEVIKKRGVDIDPIELRKRLLADAAAYCVILITRHQGRVIAIIALAP